MCVWDQSKMADDFGDRSQLVDDNLGDDLQDSFNVTNVKQSFPSQYKKYAHNSKDYLRTLLGEQELPDPVKYQHKKVTVAKKMDRLEYSNRARMEFIKMLSRNNREMEKAIICKCVRGGRNFFWDIVT